MKPKRPMERNLQSDVFNYISRWWSHVNTKDVLTQLGSNRSLSFSRKEFYPRLTFESEINAFFLVKFLFKIHFWSRIGLLLLKHKAQYKCLIITSLLLLQIMATTDSMELKWFIYVPQFSLIPSLKTVKFHSFGGMFSVPLWSRGLCGKGRGGTLIANSGFTFFVEHNGEPEGPVSQEELPHCGSSCENSNPVTHRTSTSLSSTVSCK